MSRFVQIDDRVVLQRYLERTAVFWQGWRDLRLWMPGEPLVEPGFVLEVPDLGELPQPRGVVAREFAPSSHLPIKLGELWRRARPLRRDRSGQIAEKHLLIVSEELQLVLRQLLVDCPYGLQFVTLRAAEGGEELAGFLVQGEAGRFVAHSPPIGCKAYVCDELPTGGLAALPMGWAVAPLSGGLWPQSASSVLVLVYDVCEEGHSVRCFEWVESISLADLVEPLRSSCFPIPRPLDDVKPTPWRVVRAAGWKPPPIDGLDERDRVRVVFRIRTCSRAASGPGDQLAYRVHDLGHALLQVLDECQAGLLPEVLYAAVAHDSGERWHLLYVEAADARLLEAWSVLERFDCVPQAEEHGLHVFVATTSRMMPPIAAMLDGEDGGRSVAERLRNMLGRPAIDTLVLIEDAAGSIGLDEDSPYRDAVTPRIVHLDPADARPLTEVLPQLISDWHNAEPEAAAASLVADDRVAELRARSVRELAQVGEQERAELDSATSVAVQELHDQALRAADRIEAATEPVVEADQVVARLGDALEHAGKSLDAAASGLRQVSDELTTPRRTWITDQARREAELLAHSAPLVDEAASAQRAADGACARLAERATALGNAASQLESYRPQLDGVERDAVAAAARAESARAELEKRAADVLRLLSGRERSAEAELLAARIRRDAVLRERHRVEQLEAELRAYVAENDRVDRENRRRVDEANRRRTEAEAERRRLEQVRDVEIPQLERDARDSEKRLQNLDPESIRRQLDQVGVALAGLRSQIADADLQRKDLERKRVEVEERQADLKSRIGQMQRDRDALDAQIQSARQLEELKRKIVEEIRELEILLQGINASSIAPQVLIQQAIRILNKARALAPESQEPAIKSVRRWWLWWKR